MKMKKRKTLFYIQNPNRIPYHSPGLRYSATLGIHDAPFPMVYPNGVAYVQTQPRWGKQVLGGWHPKGGGVPQPLAVLRNPDGILNTSTLWTVLRNPVGILNTRLAFAYQPPKDVGNDKIIAAMALSRRKNRL